MRDSTILHLQRIQQLSADLAGIYSGNIVIDAIAEELHLIAESLKESMRPTSPRLDLARDEAGKLILACQIPA